jgi:AcrR family transcriptional regulator
MSAECHVPGTGTGLRARKKAQTRDAIVVAAVDLFERKGYDATTIEEIAEAADVSPRTFFRYFDSKVEVIMSPKDERDEFGQQLSTRPAEEGPVEAMRQVIRTSLGAFLAEDPLFVRQMRVMLGTSSLHAIAREHFNEHEADMAREFAKRLGVAEDDLRAHVIASAVGNTIWTVVSRWVAEDSSPQRLLEMIDEACRMLASGFDEKLAD